MPARKNRPDKYGLDSAPKTPRGVSEDRQLTILSYIAKQPTGEEYTPWDMVDDAEKMEKCGWLCKTSAASCFAIVYPGRLRLAELQRRLG